MNWAKVKDLSFAASHGFVKWFSSVLTYRISVYMLFIIYSAKFVGRDDAAATSRP